MALRYATLSSVALTVALSVTGQPVSSRDDAWGGYGSQRYQGSDYDAGYGEPGRLPYEVDPEPSGYLFGTAPQAREPSWAYGDPPIPAAFGAGYGDYSGDEPNAWGQGGYAGLQREVPPGAYRGLGREPASPAGRPWPGAPGYPGDEPDSVFPPRDLVEGLERGLGPTRPVPGSAYMDPPLETYPGYRFRGDPPTHSGHWQSEPYDTGYRFRPLTEQERGRLNPGPDHRRRYPQGTAPQGTDGAPFRGEPLLQPEAAYGFEPNPWRAR